VSGTPPPSVDPRGYDAVRDALRERGYLEAPLERLFFSGRGGWLTPLLGGLVAGPPLGILLAVVLVRESRGLVPWWPDGVLYAVLFAVVMGIFVLLAELVAGLVIRVIERVRGGLSPRRASLVAGLVVAGALALYLGVWWARAGGARSLAGVLSLLLLAAGAGFAGRVVSAAALVQAALATGRAPHRRPPRAALWTLGLAVALAAGAGLTAWAVRAGEGRGEPVAVRAGAPARSILVGWDGLSVEAARGLAREGVTPWLAARLGGGAVSILRSGAESDPVAVWTTIATGCPSTVHGVSGASLRGLPGASAPAVGRGVAAGPLELLTRMLPTEQRVVRAGVRGVPAFWEVTSDARKTALVQWWGTWPASAPGSAGGYVASEGALVAARRGRGTAEAVHPASWGESRAAAWLAASEEQAGAPAGAGDAAAVAAREALVTDLFALHALEDALRDPAVAVAAVYLPGLDILRERYRHAGRDLFETLAAVRRHAAVVDSELARVVGEAPAVTIVGWPGRAGGWERGFAAWPVAFGAIPSPVDLEQVAPTFLAGAGFSVDSRICGEALGGSAWSGDRRRTRARVAAPSGAEAGGALEADVLERLRSLGYVDSR
jgi:hypothetical protein